MDRFRLAHADVTDGGKGSILLTLYPDHGLPDGEDDPTGLPPVIVELNDATAHLLETLMERGRKQMWSDLWSKHANYPPAEPWVPTEGDPF